jgi:hypothetical protein
MTITRSGDYNDSHDSLHGHSLYDVPVSTEATEQEVMEMLRNAGEMVHYTPNSNDSNVLHTQEVATTNRRISTNPISNVPMSSKRVSQNSDDWLHQRRQSHKEVERRRRETINSCINELGRILNLTASNKGVILKETIEFVSKTLNGQYALLEQHRRELDEREKRISSLENELRLLKNGKSTSDLSSIDAKRLRLD